MSFRILVPFLLLLTSCTLKINPTESQTKGVYSGYRHDDLNLNVCITSNTEQEKSCEAMVKDAMIQQFNSRTKFKFTFTCDESKYQNLSILWNEIETVSHFKTYDQQKFSEIKLICNDFKNSKIPKLSQDCNKSEDSKKNCLVNVALHEVGHALGLEHEDSRPECERFGSVYPDEKMPVLTEYDDRSIMNLCYYYDIVETTPLVLSPNDIISLNKISNNNFTFPEEQCNEGYIFVEESGQCLIEPYSED